MLNKAGHSLEMPPTSDYHRNLVNYFHQAEKGSTVDSLELKVPPPAVAMVICVAMWTLSLLPPFVAIPTVIRAVAALAIGSVGGVFTIAGLIRFRKVKTTVNPKKPHATSSLVTSGIYKFTRNPMYVGLLIVITGWAAFLCSLWALVGPVVFAMYITRFQIKPEERALEDLFGDDYTDYKSRVRRWL